MSVLRSLAFLVFLLSNLVESLNCQVNYKNVRCLPKTCPGDLVTFTYTASYAAGNTLFQFPNGTCTQAPPFSDSIVVDQGASTCNGQSGHGSCGPFYAQSIYEGGTMPCLTANLSIQVNSTQSYSILIKFGTSSINGLLQNITNSTELILTKGPGSPNVSLVSGLTNLTVILMPSPFGDSPDYYHVTLMKGTAVVDDNKNVTSNQTIFTNLSINTLYSLQVTAINCASSNVSNSTASTLPNPPSNIAAVKKEMNDSGIVLTVNWTHVGDPVTEYGIAPKCCSAVPVYAKVDTYCKAQSCSYEKYMNIAGKDLNFVTLFSVNLGGVGPESELIEVVTEKTDGGRNIPTDVGVAVGVTIAVISVVVLVLAVVVVLAIKYKSRKKYYPIIIYDPSCATVNTHHATGMQCSEAIHIYLPLKTTDENITKKMSNYLEARFRKTMGNIDIFDVTYIANPELLSKYVKHATKIKKDYADVFSEKIMFRGTLLSNPKLIALDDKGYGRNTKGSWGDGYYFSEDAIHADQYAFQNGDIKELTVALVITGYCYNVTQEETPPKKDPATQKEYDSCAGNRKSSKNANISSYCCVVFNAAQICPLYSFSYKP